MRCPFCGGLNLDQARFCTSCGRDMFIQRPPAQAAPGQHYQPQGQQPPTAPSYTQPSSYAQQRQPAPQPPRVPQPPRAPQSSRPAAPAKAPTNRPPAQSPAPVAQPARRREPPVLEPVLPPEPEAPAPFPSRTLEQLRALKPGALPFTVVDEFTLNGRKKVVSIVYQRCAAWQQVATLLQAMEQYSAEKVETLIIQGVRGAEDIESGFINGQLRYDRNVYLGSQRMNRYQIETGTGFDTASVRIVLAE